MKCVNPVFSFPGVEILNIFLTVLFLTLYALLVHYKLAEATACLCLLGGGQV